MAQTEDTVSIPFLAQLRSTTTAPIFVHPMKWSQLHLTLLRVVGLDKVYPLEQVVGRLAGSSEIDAPEDGAVADIVRKVSSFADVYYMQYIRGLRADGDFRESEETLESFLISVITIWIEQIYEKKGYSKYLRRWRPSDTPDRVFYLNFGDEKPQRLLCEYCIHNWPDENEYPASFPIVAVAGRTHDYYEPRLTSYVRLQDFDRWQRKRKLADRDAEEVAMLIALAQKHAEVLNVSRFAEDDDASRSNERLRVFHPVLMIATATTVRFVKANITQEYLKTLADPTLPLLHDLIIEQSVPIDMTKEESVPQLLAAMAALIDSYTILMKPLLAKRLPVPRNPILLDRPLSSSKSDRVSKRPASSRTRRGHQDTFCGPEVYVAKLRRKNSKTPKAV